jgi:hypothetical protein
VSENRTWIGKEEKVRFFATAIAFSVGIREEEAIFG